MKDDRKTYIIGRILDHKIDTGGETMLYKIRWAKYGQRHDSWEPEQGLVDASLCLDKYWKFRLLRIQLMSYDNVYAWAVILHGKSRNAILGMYETVDDAARAHDRAYMFIRGVKDRYISWMFPDEQPCIPSTEEIMAIESCDL